MKRFKNIFFADREDGLAIAPDRAAAVSRTNNAHLTVDVLRETQTAVLEVKPGGFISQIE
jgi:hypothetical protein